jgi:hypothetical protein
MQTTLQRKLRSGLVVGSSFPEPHKRTWMSSVAVQALDQLAARVIITDIAAAIVAVNRRESIVRLEDRLMIREDPPCAPRVPRSPSGRTFAPTTYRSGEYLRIRGRTYCLRIPSRQHLRNSNK